MNNLASFCKTNNIFYETDKSASDFSSFKIGGNVQFVIYPSSCGEAESVVSFLRKEHIDFITVGKCSNVLFPDGELPFVIIKTDNLSEIKKTENDCIICGCGVPLSKAAYFAQQNGLSGIECLFGIPGSVGGAVYMNAGAYGKDISSVAIETKYIDNDGNINIVCGEEHKFGYRESVFQKNGYIVLESIFKLSKGVPSDILSEMNGYMQRRTVSQPLNYPSAGSVFKRPEGFYAGKLIEDSGLKGYTIGGARISEKHAGFIVNIGGATSEDVKKLIKHIQNTVMDKFGVTLEPEIKIY